MNKRTHIISLGAGVQSSTMALMAAAGEITPMPDAAIFADTQGEPRAVYEWLDYLTPLLPFPVHRVTAGNLADISTTARTSGKSGVDYLPWSVPVFTLSDEGKRGMMRRQCTDKTKLAPLRKEINRLRKGGEAIVWIGISTDEVMRAKDSDHSEIEHRWPLLELEISRSDCLKWMESRKYPVPPRSACTFCPYHSDAEWLRLKADHESFAAALAYERRLQLAFAESSRLSTVPFLHASRVPLDKVEFNPSGNDAQLNLFNNECEGVCGV